jgi:outer membrane protein OmpA-like peptidoglycan-associated protein
MDSLRLDIRLNPVQDAKKLARINEIYFDFDDHQIREDAARELDKVVRLMLIDYPEMIIRIESHTDPRGSHKYNDRLSQLRATSTYTYLISQGVPKERILSFLGFGKRKPINDCGTRTDCTEEEYGLNRRTEMPIVRISDSVSFGE